MRKLIAVLFVLTIKISAQEWYEVKPADRGEDWAQVLVLVETTIDVG
jgi:hypothetical protein